MSIDVPTRRPLTSTSWSWVACSRFVMEQMRVHPWC